jgi:hypothetical protein
MDFHAVNLFPFTANLKALGEVPNTLLRVGCMSNKIVNLVRGMEQSHGHPEQGGNSKGNGSSQLTFEF